MDNEFNKGSEWRKWDLHVHTPASHGCKGSFDDLVKNMETCEAAVIGVNDYCTIDGYEEIIKRGGVKGKVLFPVVEFRMHNIIANRKGAPTASGAKINFHIIFNNTDEVFKRVKTWLGSLTCFNDKSNKDHLGNITKENLQYISFDFEQVVDSLKEVNLIDDALIWLPYDEYGGLDDIDPSDNFFKLGFIKKADIIGSSTKQQIDFFLWKNPKFSKEKYKEWFEYPLPCIKGSDAHDVHYPFGKLKDKDSNPIEKYCWIKADPTFQGLKQILNEPEDRIFIGSIPPKLEEVSLNKSKYIDSIKISHVSPASVKNTWFDNYLPLNNGLVAIIGKKGSGKSALADIISLTGKSHIKPDDYSFLNDKKFRKRGEDKKYESTVEWVDGQSVSTTLDKEVLLSEVEKVKYLPQQFVETICNEDDGVSKLFQEEIDKVIFSYVPEEDRAGASNLHELIVTKTEVIDEAIAELRTSLHDTNFEIVSREAKARTDYRTKIEAKLKEKQRELDNLTEPKVVKKPQASVSNADQDKIKKLTAEIEKTDEEIKTNTTLLTQVNTQLNQVQRLEQGIEQLKIKVSEYLSKFEKEETALSLVLSDIVELKITDSSLTTKKSQLLKSQQALQKKLDKNSTNAQSSLYAKRVSLQTQLTKITKTLDEDQKLYQNYLENVKKYKTAKEALIGKKGDTSFETITSLKEELMYISETLNAELGELRTKRESYVTRIYKKLSEKIAFFQEIYQPLIQFIAEEKEVQEKAGSVLTFDVGPVINKQSFIEKFLTFINQNRDGSFQTKEGGYKVMKSIVDKLDVAKEKGVLAFLAELWQHLTEDKTKPKPTPTDIDHQLNGNADSKVALYDFVYGLEYLNIKYKILFNGKDLNDNEFSPGEKGTLLLIFYLLIDKNTIPLVMDQPEENLDNESVFLLLVPYIKKAKRNRQIIIVTHNPNLAVVCDAEQIIAASMNKKTNEIRYIAGSIENPTLNKKVVDVLEGTMPAFNIRDYKYIKELS